MKHMFFANALVALTLAVGAFGCGPAGGDGGAREAQGAEATGEAPAALGADDVAVDEASNPDTDAASSTTCLPPKVMCPCYADGVERCVGAGLCSKCCRGLIEACVLPLR